MALKLLPDIADTDTAAHARLLHEARSAGALNHPNICTVHEVGDSNGVPFIAMELIGGETLQAALRRRPMSPERVCRIGQQLAAALEHAHAHGIVHRDLKTANVMLTSDGRSKVLDFGIATRAESSHEATRTMTQPAPNALMAGTLAYMAPEVLQGHLADARSDIWSLGVVLHEMASGHAPFQNQTDSDLAAAILRDAPAPLPSGTPAALARIIERCLAKEPDQRPAHASEVALALDIAGPVTALPSIAAAALALTVVALAGFAAWRGMSNAKPGAVMPVRLINPTQVTTSIGVEEFPAWSPDGRTIAYAANSSGSAGGGNWDIWVAQVGGGSPINRTSDHAGIDQFPSWSPDGTQVAFWSDRDGGGCYVMPALSGSARKVGAASPIDPGLNGLPTGSNSPALAAVLQSRPLLMS